MTDTEIRTNTSGNNEVTDAQDWRKSGDAWGHAAADWACLFESYATEVTGAILERTAVRDGTRLLDVACGSGLAIREAVTRGAQTAGIDAAERLIDVAVDRNPTAQLELGSMFDLPWGDEKFDVVISINGIWGGCQRALDEAYRVLRPGGKIGISFWGNGEPMDFKPFIYAVAAHADQTHIGSMITLNSISAPGVAEEMMCRSGFDVLERGSRVSTLEWVDADTAWRALRSIGPVVPALRGSDPEAVRADVLSAIDHCRDRHGIYRFTNDHHFVIAEKR